MKGTKVVKMCALPKPPKDLGIWSEGKDKERMALMFSNQQFNVDGTCAEKKNVFKISTQQKIDGVLSGLFQTGNFFYGNVSVIFDALRGMPAVCFDKYALVQHGTKRTMLVQYHMSATLSHKLAAMAKFMDDEFGFRTFEFKQWVLENLPNILPFLQAGAKENVLVESIGPRCALLFETPEAALSAFSEFNKVHVFDIHERGKGIWSRLELYTVFKSDEDDEEQSWANANSLYTLFSDELCARFMDCKYGQDIPNKLEDK